MAKFRKKPVVIEAMRWDGSNQSAAQIMRWCGRKLQNGNGLMIIDTLEGNMRANVGDWIIRGIRGEFYPCKPGIFEETYEAVDG